MITLQMKILSSFSKHPTSRKIVIESHIKHSQSFVLNKLWRYGYGTNLLVQTWSIDWAMPYAFILYNVYKLYCYFELEEVCRNKVIMEKLKVSQNDARL